MNSQGLELHGGFSSILLQSCSVPDLPTPSCLNPESIWNIFKYEVFNTFTFFQGNSLQIQDDFTWKPYLHSIFKAPVPKTATLRTGMYLCQREEPTAIYKRNPKAYRLKDLQELSQDNADPFFSITCHSKSESQLNKCNAFAVLIKEIEALLMKQNSLPAFGFKRTTFKDMFSHRMVFHF
ncbi:hypothetical protein MJT46_016193 [Ovis ammon polii x Ovis aries]|nr:hypothetical protein MJT46_016193 [Ovis ammon polii x Ovis aries]